MATRAEIRTYLTAEFGAVEFEHGQFRLELQTGDDGDRSQVVFIIMDALAKNNTMTLITPYANVNEITAAAAFEYAKECIFGTILNEDEYSLITTLFYDAMDTTSIAAYVTVFAMQADRIEDNLGLGDKY
jgi:hypothetical protein